MEASRRLRWTGAALALVLGWGVPATAQAQPVGDAPPVVDPALPTTTAPVTPAQDADDDDAPVAGTPAGPDSAADPAAPPRPRPPRLERDADGLPKALVLPPESGEGAALDPSSPLAELPGADVDWPDLGQPIDLAQPAVPAPELDAPTDEPAQLADGETGQSADDPLLGPLPGDVPPVATADASEDQDFEPTNLQRYNVVLAGFEDVKSEKDVFTSRFNELSALKQGDGDPANIAQLNRRAREDVELLDKLLRIEGYYDGFITPIVTAEGDRLVVRLEGETGPLYHYGAITLPGIEEAGADEPRFRQTFALMKGDVVNQDKIVAARTNLELDVEENGYPFARVREPDLLIDHERREGDLTVPVAMGGKYAFGGIVINKGDIFGKRGNEHVLSIARFEPGDMYKASLVEDLRRALIATGLVSRVELEPVKSATMPDRVDIAVDIEPAPPRTIAAELGYGTGEGFRAEASWEHRNMFPPEGAVLLRGVAGTREQLAAVTFRRNNLGGRDRILSLGLLASHLNRDAYDAYTVSLLGNFERKTTLIFQKEWTWSLGAEILYTDERALFLNLGNQPARQQFYIAAVSGSLNYDGTDDLLDPKKGFRLGGRIAPEISLNQGANPYVRAQIDGSYYKSVSDTIVLAGRARLGTIAGASVDDIAPTRRNYAGGGGSVRGYGYQRIGPIYTNGDPIGGRGLAEFSLEARIRLPFFGGNFGVVPFIDAGTVSTSEIPDFSTVRVGAGLGVRYYSNFGPIRIDVGTPINPAPGDSRIAVYVSLGQAF